MDWFSYGGTQEEPIHTLTISMWCQMNLLWIFEVNICIYHTFTGPHIHLQFTYTSCINSRIKWVEMLPAHVIVSTRKKKSKIHILGVVKLKYTQSRQNYTKYGSNSLSLAFVERDWSSTTFFLEYIHPPLCQKQIVIQQLNGPLPHANPSFNSLTWEQELILHVFSIVLWTTRSQNQLTLPQSAGIKTITQSHLPSQRHVHQTKFEKHQNI